MNTISYVGNELCLIFWLEWTVLMNYQMWEGLHSSFSTYSLSFCSLVYLIICLSTLPCRSYCLFYLVHYLVSMCTCITISILSYVLEHYLVNLIICFSILPCRSYCLFYLAHYYLVSMCTCITILTSLSYLMF